MAYENEEAPSAGEAPASRRPGAGVDPRPVRAVERTPSERYPVPVGRPRYASAPRKVSGRRRTSVWDAVASVFVVVALALVHGVLQVHVGEQRRRADPYTDGPGGHKRPGHGAARRVVRRTRTKNGAPKNAVTTPIGISAGDMTVRASRSARARNAPPNSSDSGRITR